MSNQKKSICLLSIILFLLITCVNVKKDKLYAKEDQKESTEMSMINSVDENYLNKKNELIELIKKVPYPDEPDQIILWILKKTESFLILNEHSDELLDYALDLFQDETLTYYEKKVVAYVLIGVEFEKYKYFLRDLSLCYLNGGKLDRHLVAFCFYPGPPGSDLGIRGNFQDPVVIEALEAYKTFRKQ